MDLYNRCAVRFHGVKSSRMQGYRPIAWWSTDFVISLFYIPKGKENYVSVPPHITLLCAPHISLRCVPPHITLLCAPTYHHALCVPPHITTLCASTYHHLCVPTYHHAVYVPPHITMLSVCPYISPCSLVPPHITMLSVYPHISPCSLVPPHITMLSVCLQISSCSLCAPTYHHDLCVPPHITTISVCPHISPRSLCPPYITMLFVSKPPLNQLTVMAINVNGMPLEASNNSKSDVQICEVGTALAALKLGCGVAICHILLRFCS